MSHDELFRWILIAIFSILFPIAVYHRVRSESTFEKLDRLQEGLFILITLRVTALAKLFGLVAFLVDPTLMEWSASPLPVSLRWSGVVISILSCVLLISTFITLGPNLTDTVVTRANHTLVTSGPYRWIRHPFYLAFFGTVLGDSLVTANWFIALSGGICCVLIFFRTEIEERNLEARFGEPYRRYRAETGMLLPRPR